MFGSPRLESRGRCNTLELMGVWRWREILLGGLMMR